MILQTTTRARSNHPEFRVCYDPAITIETDVRWFVSGLESVANGERFSDGQTYQIGWMLSLIRGNDDGTLSIHEPDMKSFPVSWLDSVSRTLSQLRLQKDICESVLTSDSLRFPSMRESVIVCNQLGVKEDLVMDRTEPSQGISGWFCGCLGEDHDHQDVEQLQCVSLYEAATKYHPGIVPYLALPVGVLVALKERTPTILLGDEQLPFKPKTYLHRMFGGV